MALFPYMVVLTVVAAAFSQVCLCLVKGHLINERFVRVGRYDPILLGNGNLFAGLDACLAGFPKQRIAKVNLILYNSFYCGVIPAIRGAGGACVGKVVAVQYPVLKRRNHTGFRKIMRNFDAGVACGGALENLRDDWRGFLVRD